MDGVLLTQLVNETSGKHQGTFFMLRRTYMYVYIPLCYAHVWPCFNLAANWIRIRIAVRNHCVQTMHVQCSSTVILKVDGFEI